MTSTDEPPAGPARLPELGAPEDDPAIVAVLLAEPDRLTAESVLLSLVDRRAEDVAPAEAFAAWAEPVLAAVGTEGFVARRVQEWGLVKALGEGAPVDREALAEASNWLQRKLVEEAPSAAVLTVLGEVGRTKRVRNLAKTGAGRLRSPRR